MSNQVIKKLERNKIIIREVEICNVYGYVCKSYTYTYPFCDLSVEIFITSEKKRVIGLRALCYCIFRNDVIYVYDVYLKNMADALKLLACAKMMNFC